MIASIMRVIPEMNPANLDLKQTINLPRTNFSMKANLPQAEPKMLARWAEEDLYGQIRNSRAGKPVYILHDGPPYANGRIHLGTAFNKIVKDFIVKSRTMAGYDSPYVPGWDCHGLPIEHKVDQELGAKKAQMTAAPDPPRLPQVRRKMGQSPARRLQAPGRPRPLGRSLSHDEARVPGRHRARLRRFPRQRLRLQRPQAGQLVHPRPHRARRSRSRIRGPQKPVGLGAFRADLRSRRDRSRTGRQDKSTASSGPPRPGRFRPISRIAFHPKFEYVAVAGRTTPSTSSPPICSTRPPRNAAGTNPAILARFHGNKLDRTVFRHPFIDRDSLGILGDHVTLEQGTGAVHTAPGHGQEDYVVGMQYGLPVYCPVDAAGRFFEAGRRRPGAVPPQLLGKTVWEGNPLVIEILKEHGALLALEHIEHSYPHCWRCHNATIFRATEQWFIGMDNNSLRQNALDAIKGVKWMPEWGEERISNMVSSRPDWCISRQRVWGVPIVVFYCAACREPLTDRKILDAVVDLFEQHSADIWFERTAAELIPAGTVCTKVRRRRIHQRKRHSRCLVRFRLQPSRRAQRSERPSLARRPLHGRRRPVSRLVPEFAPDRRRACATPRRIRAAPRTAGLSMATAAPCSNPSATASRPKRSSRNTARNSFASGPLRSISPKTCASRPTILTRLSEAYRKLRNTFRYALGNIHDFNPATDAVPGDQLLEIDQWILVRAEELVARCRIWYDEFAFHKVYRAVYDFATVDLSSIYFDVLKDRLYTSATKSHARRSAQTALYRLRSRWSACSRPSSASPWKKSGRI